MKTIKISQIKPHFRIEIIEPKNVYLLSEYGTTEAAAFWSLVGVEPQLVSDRLPQTQEHKEKIRTASSFRRQQKLLIVYNAFGTQSSGTDC